MLWRSLRVELGKPAGPPISIGFRPAAACINFGAVYGLVWRDGAIGIIRTGPFGKPNSDEEIDA